MKKVKVKDLQVGDIYCTEKEYSKRISRKALIITPTHVCSFDREMKTHKTKKSEALIIVLRNQELTKNDKDIIKRNRF